MKPAFIDINDYDYGLPEGRISAKPLMARAEAKLLRYDGQIEDRTFSDLPGILDEGDALIFNNSKVINARFHFKKATGGVVEIFCLNPADNLDPQVALASSGPVRWNCLVGGAKKWKSGQVFLSIPDSELEISASRVSSTDDGWVIEFEWDQNIPFSEVLSLAGNLPLPPYIKRDVQSSDHSDYQTVYSKPEGSVAAPTAGLHFTEEIMEKLGDRKVTKHFLALHVGAGTFRPVSSDNAAVHEMHAETFVISMEQLKSLRSLDQTRRIAVGTTVARTLESIYWLGVKQKHSQKDMDWTLNQWEVYDLPQGVSWAESLSVIIEALESKGENLMVGQTSLMIVPGYEFHIDALMTNFHLPKSTLLLLVSALIGEDWKKVYDHALNSGYRFLSYGDTSILWPKKKATL